MKRLYFIYGIVILSLLGFAEYRGLSTLRANEARNAAPRSVRDNPGAYRAQYVLGRRYVGGK